MFTIVVAQENAFIFKTESDGVDEPACFQGADRALNKFFTTRHFLSVRPSL